jgi:hypothetical protein
LAHPPERIDSYLNGLAPGIEAKGFNPTRAFGERMARKAPRKKAKKAAKKKAYYAGKKERRAKK